MSVPQGEQARPESLGTYRSRASQWSKTAWAVALLFGSLPLTSRIFLGTWGFPGAAEISCVFLILGAYFYFIGRRRFRTIPDAATTMDQAARLASTGHVDRAIGVLTRTIRVNPKLWQALQYRGELHLLQCNTSAAIQDFSGALQLAPREPHLYLLRGRAFGLLGDELSSRSDHEKAAALAAESARYTTS